MIMMQLAENPLRNQILYWSIMKIYWGIQRVCNESITAKLHILSPNILTGYLKASEVTWISAIHTIFSHPPVHSGPISFSKVENLKLTSGTNKSKYNFDFQQNQLKLTIKSCGDQKKIVKILLSNYYIKPISKR